ncbi:MAG: hypothetical protein WC712_07065 [Candidatus Brocadiia bacterium]
MKTRIAILVVLLLVLAALLFQRYYRPAGPVGPSEEALALLEGKPQAIELHDRQMMLEGLGDSCVAFEFSDGEKFFIERGHMPGRNRLFIIPCGTKPFTIIDETHMLVTSGRLLLYPANLKYKLVPLCEGFADSFSRQGSSESLVDWRAVGGDWAIASMPEPRFSASPFDLTANCDKRALLLTGAETNCRYIFKAAIRSGRHPSSFGVVAGASQEGKRGVAAVWRPINGWWGELALLDLASGAAMKTRPMRMKPDNWYDFALAITDGQAYFNLDSYPVLSCNSTMAQYGLSGLYLSGGSAVYDDAAVIPLAEATGKGFQSGWQISRVEDRMKAAYIPTDFLKDPAMAEWATTSSDWLYFRGAQTSEYRHKLRFSEDLFIRFEISNERNLPSGLRLAGSADSEDGRVEIRFSSADGKLKADLAQGKLAPVALFEGEVKFPLRLVASCFPAGGGAEVGLTVADGDRRALPIQSAPKTFSPAFVCRSLPFAISVASSSYRDYSFASAPVDFERKAGEWLIASRWACSPQYSWYGGISTPSACIETKYDLVGNFSLDVFAAPLMASYMRPGYRNPTKIRLEAKNSFSLGSGYSLVYGDGKYYLTAPSFGGTPGPVRSFYSDTAWFHNIWLHFAMSFRDGTLSGSEKMSGETKLKAEALKDGPATIYLQRDDYTFARIRIVADAIRPRAPEGLDTKVPAPVPPAKPLEGGIRPLLSDADWVALSDPVECDLSYTKLGPTLVLAARPNPKSGVMSVRIPVAEVSADEYRAWRVTFTSDLPEQADTCLSFRRGGSTYLVPLIGGLPEPDYRCGYFVPERYILRETLKVPDSSEFYVVTLFAGTFADDYLKDYKSLFTGFEIISMNRMDPLKPLAFSDQSGFYLASLDFLTVWMLGGDQTLPEGYSPLFDADPASAFVPITAQDGRLAWLARGDSTPLDFARRNDAMVFDVTDSLGPIPGKCELSIKAFGLRMPVPLEVIEVNGQKVRMAAITDPGKYPWGLINLAHAFARAFGKGSRLHDYISFSYSRGIYREKDDEIWMTGGAGAATSSTNVFLTALSRDGEDCTFRIELPTPPIDDDGAKPLLIPCGGPHALFPLAERTYEGWNYLCSKRDLGGFSGLSLDLGAIDTRAYPYFRGEYACANAWKLQFPPKNANQGDWYSMGETIVSGEEGKRTEGRFVRKTTMDLPGTPLIPDLRFGNYMYTTAEEEWWLRLKDLHLVPRVFGKRFDFSVTDCDVPRWGGMEYVFVRASTGPNTPPFFEPKFTKLCFASVEASNAGLYWLGVRVYDGRKHVSSVRWTLMDVSAQEMPPTRFLSSTPTGGGWNQAIQFRLANVSPTTVSVEAGGVRWSVARGDVRFLGETKTGDNIYGNYTFTPPPKFSGEIRLTIRGRGYDGGELMKVVRMKRDPAAVPAPRITSATLVPTDSLVCDNYETGVGSASGRRGAYVAQARIDGCTGDRCLDVVPISPNDYYSVYLYSVPFSAKEHRYVSFRYKSLGARLTLMLQVEDMFYDIQIGSTPVGLFPDEHQEGRYKIAGFLGYSSGLIGSVLTSANIGEWNDITVDIYDLLSRAMNRQGDILVTAVALREAGYNGITVRAYVDDFRIWSSPASCRLIVATDTSIPASALKVELLSRDGIPKTLASAGGTAPGAKLLNGNGQEFEVRLDGIDGAALELRLVGPGGESAPFRIMLPISPEK